MTSKKQKHPRFHKTKDGMSFSRFCGYSSDQAAKNARDKMAKELMAEGKVCKISTSNEYAGGTLMKTFLITDVRKR